MNDKHRRLTNVLSHHALNEMERVKKKEEKERERERQVVGELHILFPSNVFSCDTEFGSKKTNLRRRKRQEKKEKARKKKRERREPSSYSCMQLASLFISRRIVLSEEDGKRGSIVFYT
ncbi:hypothetical protein ALC62_08446 [Cyphomyrmex costatus]|uniref:Uncharacterized protein n=1 Tax=Cyphomyrmex costatus TaxID=456900 RepID=A0A195CJ69_9HYME|nr:hypothetical protein ALC62_08446 [Cyphomyrmex costatus]